MAKSTKRWDFAMLADAIMNPTNPPSVHKFMIDEARYNKIKQHLLTVLQEVCPQSVYEAKLGYFQEAERDNSTREYLVKTLLGLIIDYVNYGN